ncbi:hypothetical protein KW409_00335 [Vibrio fluvialis]|uniref:hypothetical protein n=1 Tax=Vibrio fluvialis TaxID=676 RepID=UPI000645ECD4|nr:hypothetical protein [Vibrio fluvialis]MBY7865380.1 hypothetical protein [Vibrio fluvialis]MBY7904083.1 hypothetical protein [Vibrio fluvialis]MBY8152947.1 hypothetical protein [Vibrio fluvialis]MBY8173990.1 hypothetical protein [Vibrio fluvialis]MBY8196367.1 hypothetical protein [Vibrio fluvialis]
MDDLISMLLRVFGRVFMLLLEIRLVGWFFYTVGYAISKTVTLGKFPAGNDDAMRMKISYLGLVIIIGVLLLVGIFNTFILR